jgi:hypothetical protein
MLLEFPVVWLVPRKQDEATRLTVEWLRSRDQIIRDDPRDLPPRCRRVVLVKGAKPPEDARIEVVAQVRTFGDVYRLSQNVTVG